MTLNTDNLKTDNLKTGNFAIVQQVLANYFSRVGWLMLDSWQYFKGRILLMVLLNWVGVTSAAFVFGGFILYVRYLEAGRPLTVLGLNIRLESIPVLALSAFVLLCLGVLSSICLYQMNWMAANLAVACHKHAIYRLFRMVSDPAYQGWQRFIEGPPSLAMKVFLGKSRISAMGLRSLLSGIVPTVTFLLSVTFLVSTSLSLTALLIPLVLVYLVPLYQANHWIVQNQVDYAKYGRPAQKKVSQSLQDAIDTHSNTDQTMALAEIALDNGEYERAALLFYARKMASTRLRLVNTIFFTVCVTSIFVFFTLSSRHGEYRWSSLLTYVVALQFAFNGLQQITNILGRMSRLTFNSRHYVDFMSQVEPYRRQRQRSPLINQPLPDQLCCAFSETMLPETQRYTELRPGQSIWAIIPDEPSRIVLEATAARLETTLIPPADLLSKSSIIAELIADDNHSHAEHQTALQKILDDASTPLAFYLRLSQLRTEIESYVATPPHEPLPPLSDEANCLLKALPLFQSSKVIWIDVSLLFKLDPDFVEALLTSFPTSYIILATSDPAKALKRPALKSQWHQSTTVLVYGNRGVSGCGNMSWLKDYLEDIKTYLSSQLEAANSIYDTLDETDEDEQA